MSKRPAPAERLDDVELKRNKTTSQVQGSADMASPKAIKRILVLGLSGHAPSGSAVSSTKPPRGRFRQGLKQVVTRAKEHNMELETMQVKPSAFSTALPDIREKLRARPDGFMIGNGIRGTAEYSVFFEDLVNASREISPDTRLAFNTSPDDIWECCLRNFG